MIGVSQLVGMVPEGLPVAMTIGLAVGVQRMAKRRAIVRRLSAVETLGSTTIICTDKTGTLTRNEMTVTALWLPDGRQLSVTGVGYAPEGQVLSDAHEIRAAADDPLRALLEATVLCNDAELLAPDSNEREWRPIGDPTEVALLTVAVKAGMTPSEVRARIPRRAEIPFDSGAKMMATEHDGGDGPFLLVKGAPEAVFDLCSAADEHTEAGDELLRAARAGAERMAADALRVLAVAIARRTRLDESPRFAAL
jgi:Ca2+-transporting ATPase